MQDIFIDDTGKKISEETMKLFLNNRSDDFKFVAEEFLKKLI